MPKSVTKINKNGVTFIDSVDAAIYTLEELERAAFKDVAKLLRREIVSDIPKRTGRLRKNVATWVKKSKGDGKISLLVGIYTIKQARRKNKPPAYHSHLVQFGTGLRTSKKTGKSTGVMPEIPYLDVAVERNIDKIREIQSKYLSGIELNNSASLIDEREEISDDT